MEQGLAAGLVDDFMDVHSEEVRMHVERSPDRKEFLLSTNDGSRRLLARLTDNGFNIFIARDGEPPIAVGPMFQLVANSAKTKWTLCTATCDRCEKKGRRLCGKRDLAYIKHHNEHLGQNEVELHCMDIQVPCGSDDGKTEIWCPVCSPEGKYSSLDFTSLRPKWNARMRTLNMNFHGRVKLSSAKNFQLALVDKPEKVRLLFGKVAQNKYVMDFKGPLNMIQAFAAVVSTSVWG
jgi:hypothetical protein